MPARGLAVVAVMTGVMIAAVIVTVPLMMLIVGILVVAIKSLEMDDNGRAHARDVLRELARLARNFWRRRK